MSLSDLRLALMTFAQRWDGSQIHATVLVIPSGDPTKPLMSGTKAFGGTTIKLRAAAIAGLDAFPDLGAASDGLVLPAPTKAAGLFGYLKAQFKPVDTVAKPPAKAPPAGLVRKALPDSYLAQLPPGRSPSRYVATADEFGCTVMTQTPRPPKKKPDDPSWGAVISHALRNPPLADALGLRYEFRLPIAKPADFAGGGWLFVTLDPADGGTGYAGAWAASPDAVKCYGTRLPALTGKRQLFSAVLFPVANPGAAPVTPDESALDQAIIEAETYDDGFAKILHARQPDTLDAHIGDGKTNVNPASDVGVQIGWDDEQVLEWQNRQVQIAAAASKGDEPDLESPLGVLGYRIDVREPVPGETPAQKNKGWKSLMGADATLPKGFAGKLDAFSGELTIEPTASAASRDLAFWLPLYFAQWRGTPIGVRDDTPHLLAGGAAAGIVPQLAPSQFEGQPVPALLYGHDYEFRTRLADLSGGGPDVKDLPVNETIAERASIAFQRFLPPKGFQLETKVVAPRTAQQPDKILLRRPIIGYPEALFTPRYGSDPAIRDAARAAMLAQLGLGPDGTAIPKAQRVDDHGSIGLPDPDVVRIEITVEVRALAHDSATDVSADGIFTAVYNTTRDIPALGAIPKSAGGDVKPKDAAKDVAIPPIELTYVDVDEITGLAAPAAGALLIPRARDVRLLLTPIAAGPAGYFGTIDANSGRPQPTRGVTSHILLRAAAKVEAPLFGPPASGKPALEAMYFQPVAGGDPVAGMMSRMADVLDLEVDGLMLRARPGERVIFGTSGGFKNTIAPDGSTFTFGAAAEIFRKWTIVLQQQVLRDWSWDGLANDRVQVALGGKTIGTVNLPWSASVEALAGIPDRKTTRLIFIDAVDPAVPVKADGYTDREPYVMRASIPREGSADLKIETDPLALRLPVVIIPSGVPELASAGYALSKYEIGPAYASTSVRERNLWLEVKQPPAHGDGLFARILAYAPDPVLYVDPALLQAKPPLEPALILDPELIRQITPSQPRDSDGLEAMVQLEPSSSDPHRFLLPIPAGVSRDDPRLFGMWTYELRYGHVDPWSTAHGRYSRPLRVTGVQHPAPHLSCNAAWRPLPIKGIKKKNKQLYGYAPGIGGRVTDLPYALVMTAPYAIAVLNNRRVGDGFPRTTIGFLLYAQARQADGHGHRNVLLAHRGAMPVVHHDQVDYGETIFSQVEIQTALSKLGLPANSPLSALAVEFYGPGGIVGREYQRDNYKRRVAETGRAEDRYIDRPIDGIGWEAPDPFARNVFGRRRILRTSPLSPVEPVC